MAKSKTGEFKMDKPYGLTMRGIVKNSNDEILILRRHPKSRTNPHKWELPGGKVDPGEFFDEALVREIKEETNLDGAVGDFYEAIQDLVRLYTHFHLSFSISLSSTNILSVIISRDYFSVANFQIHH